MNEEEFDNTFQIIFERLDEIENKIVQINKKFEQYDNQFNSVLNFIDKNFALYIPPVYIN